MSWTCSDGQVLFTSSHCCAQHWQKEDAKLSCNLFIQLRSSWRPVSSVVLAANFLPQHKKLLTLLLSSLLSATAIAYFVLSCHLWLPRKYYTITYSLSVNKDGEKWEYSYSANRSIPLEINFSIFRIAKDVHNCRPWNPARNTKLHVCIRKYKKVHWNAVGNCKNWKQARYSSQV